jgi:hypothetical protein
MSDFKARAIGMVWILIGLAAVWFFGLRAVAAAWQGTGPVMLSGKPLPSDRSQSSPACS